MWYFCLDGNLKCDDMEKRQNYFRMAVSLFNEYGFHGASGVGGVKGGLEVEQWNHDTPSVPRIKLSTKVSGELKLFVAAHSFEGPIEENNHFWAGHRGPLV